ncbi:MAG: Crp/Fnr family transcriptional regulator [Dyadobacter sp.]|uniref:Crp/Fnr family transcriptional regulator n=1 Tax=Dyadobacter sp. TaxID=1914288 RepID=UPI00326561B3
MQDPLQHLHSLVNAIQPLSEDDWLALSSIWKPFQTRRKEIVTTIGEKEKHLYFVIEGVQRVYYLDEQNREATIVFTYAPSFGGVVDSLLLEQPSRYYYETLTPSRFLKAPYSELKLLMNERPAIERMVRLGLTQTLSGVMERLVEVQCFSSEDKFRKLLLRSPHILQLVPHKYLANYLGIDPTNFSKLVNKVRI